MVKQSLSGLIAISMVAVAPSPVLAANSAPPACVSSGDPIIQQAWDKASDSSAGAKKIRALIRQECGSKRKMSNELFLKALHKYVESKPEASIGCLDPDNCPNAKGPIQKSGIDDIASKIDGSGKVTDNTPPRPAPATPAPASGEKLSDGGPSKMDGTPPPAVPLREPTPPPAAPAPRFVAASDTNLSQNLMWGLGGALVGGAFGYLLGSNNNNNNGYYNNMMMPPMFRPPWMQPRPPFGMNFPPVLPPIGQQPWMNRLGMGGMGGFPGGINPGAPGAIPLMPGAGISPFGGYGGYGNLGGYGGLGGIGGGFGGGMPSYYMPGAGQISTGIAPPILPQYPGVPAYSNMLRAPPLGGGY